jgi:hypothetical protein
VNGTLTFERYKPRPGEVPGGYVGYCVKISVRMAGGIAVSNLLAPDAVNAQSIWLFAAEALEKAADYRKVLKQEVEKTVVEYGGATDYCKIVHAEGYIHRTEERVAGNKKITLKTPAVRIVIEINGKRGRRIIPCADALCELHSVNDWAHGFAEIVAGKIRDDGGKVDPDALRSEFAKIMRDAIQNLDVRDAPKIALPVLH